MKARSQPKSSDGTTDHDAFDYEFCGPLIGPIALIAGLPAICYLLYYACNAQGCASWTAISSMPGFANTPLITWSGVLVYFGWFMFVVLLHLILPGTWVAGTVLPNGGVLEYKLNGIQCLIIALGAVAINAVTKDATTLSWVYDHFVPLLGGSVCFSMLLSIALYAASFAPNRLLAHGGTSGWHVYDFFMGRELNPRWGAFDWKEFCELYPGLIGWVVIDLAMAYKQHQLYGYVTMSMLLVCAFHLLYVADALFFEKCVLTTMDITTEGFGFMLAFGDLTWVPFTYSLQARYLVDHPTHLSWTAVLVILALHTVGYAIFRGANRQKDIFRADPSDPRVKHVKTLCTQRGRMLMVSSWWGLSRHINYFGDWLMGLCWCLPCGLDSPVPYFYAIYFAALLRTHHTGLCTIRNTLFPAVHRAARDDQSCRRKYGKDWDKYCALVPYRIIPFVY